MLHSELYRRTHLDTVIQVRSILRDERRNTTSLELLQLQNNAQAASGKNRHNKLLCRLLLPVYPQIAPRHIR